MRMHRAPAGADVPAAGGGAAAAKFASVARAAAERVRENLSDPRQVLALVLIAALAVRVIWLALPAGSLIFDESYYVNAARVLLGWTVPNGANYASAPAGLDPNTEHPPLGKVLMAGSMLLFGDNGLGWRVPSVIAAMIGLLALYWIVRSAGESAWLGVLAVGFFAFDNLALVQGRIGTLDMMALAPILLGAGLALRGRWGLAGVATAIGSLVKLTAVYGLLALLMLQAVSLWQAWRREGRLTLADVRPGLALLASYALVFVAGLWLLDARVTSYSSPIDHLRHMIEYGANLRTSPQPPGAGTAISSTPWQWLFNEGQINYLRVDVTTKVGEKIIASRASIDFRGALNPILAGAIPVALMYAGWRAWRHGRLARWAVIWAAANYLPYVVLALITQRIMYIYYFLPVVPALAVAVALFLRRARLPRAVMWGYVALYMAAFAAYFPFRQVP